MIIANLFIRNGLNSIQVGSVFFAELFEYTGQSITKNGLSKFCCLYDAFSAHVLSYVRNKSFLSSVGNILNERLEIDVAFRFGYIGMWELNQSNVFDETLPYLDYLNQINQLGLKTISSQPGHRHEEYNEKEHTYPNGYGYIQGYIDASNNFRNGCSIGFNVCDTSIASSLESPFVADGLPESRGWATWLGGDRSQSRIQAGRYEDV